MVNTFNKTDTIKRYFQWHLKQSASFDRLVYDESNDHESNDHNQY